MMGVVSIITSLLLLLSWLVMRELFGVMGVGKGTWNRGNHSMSGEGVTLTGVWDLSVMSGFFNAGGRGPGSASSTMLNGTRGGIGIVIGVHHGR